MSSGEGSTLPHDPTKAASEEQVLQTKGKGKAAEDVGDTSMNEDDDDDDEDDDEENEAGDDDADDNLDEIDLNNIVEGGRRTRGRVIDWAKAAEENPTGDDDDDEDEDDYQPAVEVEEDGDKMDED
ncbi:histone chaperone domain CHZ-domain-containing protein [Durotheca rogersii]|uniref:histone chaperone domain CHZ-domain-containing protein n=1 Tax=Durotheca rogersii TaxID=419775 RepID=UPI00221EACF9|nr:histone chaperone domain CHZ-domain-containing protein [Durotheca rogersii]KAI5863352.1 histone chaperone domain CHZ-domain-containing protein [Durotheca rogersii]